MACPRAESSWHLRGASSVVGLSGSHRWGDLNIDLENTVILVLGPPKKGA